MRSTTIIDPRTSLVQRGMYGQICERYTENGALVQEIWECMLESVMDAVSEYTYYGDYGTDTRRQYEKIRSARRAIEEQFEYDVNELDVNSHTMPGNRHNICLTQCSLPIKAFTRHMYNLDIAVIGSYVFDGVTESMGWDSPEAMASS